MDYSIFEMKLLSLILPTYNEAGHIVDLITVIQETLDSINVCYELVIVDDNSEDGTSNLVKELAENDSRILLFSRRNEKGLTSALSHGIDNSKGDYIGWLDCDFQHPPDLLPDLIETSTSPKRIAVASRYVGVGNDSRTSTAFGQRFLSSLISLLCRSILRISTRDITSGYIVIKRNYLEEIGKLNGSHGEYFIDLIFRLEKHGYIVEEVPYTCVDRRTGVSKTADSSRELIMRGIPYLRTLFRLRLTGISE